MSLPCYISYKYTNRRIRSPIKMKIFKSRNLEEYKMKHFLYFLKKQPLITGILAIAVAIISIHCIPTAQDAALRYNGFFPVSDLR